MTRLTDFLMGSVGGIVSGTVGTWMVMDNKGRKEREAAQTIREMEGGTRRLGIGAVGAGMR